MRDGTHSRIARSPQSERFKAARRIQVTTDDRRRLVGSRCPDAYAHDDLIPRRVWELRKDAHETAINLRAVPGIGAEIVLTESAVLCGRD